MIQLIIGIGENTTERDNESRKQPAIPSQSRYDFLKFDCDRGCRVDGHGPVAPRSVKCAQLAHYVAVSADVIDDLATFLANRTGLDEALADKK